MGNDIAFTGVRRDQIIDIWPLVADIIKRGCDKFNNLTLDGVFDDLHSGSQLWVAGCNDITSVCVTRIYKNGNCNIELCAGQDVDKIVSFLPIIEQWAKENGAKRMRMQGRPGWRKKLTSYKLEKIIMEKSL